MSVQQPTGTPTALVVAVMDDGSETVLGRIGVQCADVELVDALVRLQLAARRSGWRVCVRDVPDGLRCLLDLVGLAEVLRVEPGRQPEVGEELRVDEVVQPGDAFA
jgi:hypothetical protein